MIRFVAACAVLAAIAMVIREIQKFDIVEGDPTCAILRPDVEPNKYGWSSVVW